MRIRPWMRTWTMNDRTPEGCTRTPKCASVPSQSVYSDALGLAAAMAVFMVSLSGLPPTGGFVAKFQVFSAALNGGYVWLTVIAVLNSVVAVYYYLRLVVVMYMREPQGGVVKRAPHPGWTYAVTALVLAVASTLQLGIFPSSVLDFAHRSTVFFN